MGPAALPWTALFTAQQWTVILLALCAGLALKAFVLWWLYRDTRARGRKPLVWLLVAIPFDLPTFIVWLIVRPVVPGRGAPAAARVPPDATASSAATAPPDGAPGASPLLPPAPSASAEAPGQSGSEPQRAASPVPSPPAALARRVRVTCPRCSERFVVHRAGAGPTAIACPACGTKGRL